MLTHFEYSAELHETAVHLQGNDISVDCVNNTHQLQVSVTFSASVPVDVLAMVQNTSTRILIGDESMGCDADGDGIPESFKFSISGERVWTKASDDSRVMSFDALPSAHHECFEHSHLEYFAGHPTGLLKAREERMRSEGSYSKSEAVVQSIWSTLKTPVVPDVPTSDANRRKLLSCPCGSCREIKAVSVIGRDCTTSGSEADDCFYGTDGSAFMVGNTYKLTFNSPVEQRVYINYVEQDAGMLYGSSKSTCGSMQWSTNGQTSAYFPAKAGANTIKFEFPDLSGRPCMQNEWSPRIRLEVANKENCYFGASPYYTIAWGNKFSGTIAFPVPASVNFGKSRTGKVPSGKTCNIPAQSSIDFTCKDCSVKGSSDVHVVIKTTDKNPFAESWIWGDVKDLTMDMNLLFKVQQKIKGECTTVLKEKFCFPGLCAEIGVAGIRMYVGIFIDLWSKAILDWQTNIEYNTDSKFKTSGTGFQHLLAGTMKSSEYNGFEIKRVEDSAPKEIFSASVNGHGTFAFWPSLYFGVFASVKDWVSAHAYIQARRFVR